MLSAVKCDGVVIVAVVAGCTLVLHVGFCVLVLARCLGRPLNDPLGARWSLVAVGGRPLEGLVLQAAYSRCLLYGDFGVEVS